jgi:muconolactone delta-isomerase
MTQPFWIAEIAQLTALHAKATELAIFAWMDSTLTLMVHAHPNAVQDLFGALSFNNA